MFYPEKMCKIRIIERKANLRKTIGALEQFGGAEIKKFHSEGLQNTLPLEEGTEAGERLVKVDAVLSGLKEHPIKGAMDKKDVLGFLKSRESMAIEEQVGNAQLEKEKLQSAIDTAEE